MIHTLLTTAFLLAGPTQPAPVPFPSPLDPPTERTPCLWMGHWICPEGFTPPDWPTQGGTP